jgi:hypothetical protein
MGFTYMKTLPKYELFYIKWSTIGHDKEKLVNFLKRIERLKFLRLFSRSYKEEYRILNEILGSYDFSKLQLLLDNEETYCRIATLEKYARKGAVEILIDGVFSKETYSAIMNLPPKDFKLLIKRTNEIIEMQQSLQLQEEKPSNEIPGL